MDDLLSTSHDPITVLALFIGIFLGISLVMVILNYYTEEAIKKNKKDKDNTEC